MRNLLLVVEAQGSASDWVAKVSDLFRSIWPELLAILSSSAFIIGVITFIGKLILLKAKNKGALKVAQPFLDYTKQAKEMNELFMKQITEQILPEIKKEIQDTINEARQKEIETNKQLCEQIISGDEETKRLVEEAPVKEIEAVEIKTQEMAVKTQENEAVNEIVNETQEVAKNTEKKAKTTKVVAKKVIEG